MQIKIEQGRIPAFKERFRAIVESYGGQTEFANKSGISRQTIGFWYNGDRVPNAEMLIAISKSCGVSVDYLLGLTECASNDANIRAVCDYTGLSEKAVKALRVETEYSKCGTLDEMELNFGDYVSPEIIDFMIKNERKLSLFQTFEQYISAKPINQTMIADANGRMENATDNPTIGIEMSEALEDTQPNGYFYIFNSSQMIERLMIDEIEKQLKKAREFYAAENEEARHG